MVHRLKFYPVGNGDTVQLILSNDRRVLFDYHHSPEFEKSSSPAINLARELKAELDADDIGFFDVVAFTHADLDHVQGSTEFFELEHAECYKGDGRIKIKELWMPAAILLEKATRDCLSDEWVILRNEGWYRLLDGKGIKVFSKPKELADKLAQKLAERKEQANARDHLFVDAGQIVNGFSLGKDFAEFFCHSPFKKHCEDGDIIRNDASLVFNITLRAGIHDYKFFEIGDAPWDVMEDIVNITKHKKNDHRLDWDVMNISHHCSYTALNDEKGDKKTALKPGIKELLGHGADQVYIVSCSDPIHDTKESYKQKMPPHIQAKNAYMDILSSRLGREFLVTMEEPNELHPKPIEIEFSELGLSYNRSRDIGSFAMPGITPPRAG